MIMVSKRGWRLYGVQSKDVPLIWDELLPMIRRVVGLEYSCDTEKSLLTEILCQNYQLWLGFTPSGKIGLVFITTIEVRPRYKACVVLYAAGEKPREWLEFSKAVTLWAKQKNCQRLEVCGRKGWVRVLQRIGFEPVTHVLQKVIKDGRQ